MFRILSALVLTASLAACVDDATASSAQASTDPTGSGDHRPPPQEALDACASSSAGAACAFDLDSHHVTGTCRQPDASKPLACAPDAPPPPPQEALDACASSSAGAACAFDVDSHHVTGTCRQPDASKPLACAPDQPPPH